MKPVTVERVSHSYRACSAKKTTIIENCSVLIETIVAYWSDQRNKPKLMPGSPKSPMVALY